jgi:hypothetical protein
MGPEDIASMVFRFFQEHGFEFSWIDLLLGFGAAFLGKYGHDKQKDELVILAGVIIAWVLRIPILTVCFWLIYSLAS